MCAVAIPDKNRKIITDDRPPDGKSTKVMLGDWLTNAGIVGYLRIVHNITDVQQHDISRGFIQLNPENDLKFFADAYFSYVLMRVIEDLFLEYPFHHKIKTCKKNDSIDDFR
jgi:hypothetical protein